MESGKFTELFARHPGNPIIKPEDLPYLANSVFNAGATQTPEGILLLMRVEDRRGISHLTIARSRDGISGWQIEEKPALIPEPEDYPEEIWGIEDPRITWLEEEGLWAVLYTSFSQAGPLVSLLTTPDFKTFKRLGAVLAPENKDAALFPVRFQGRWLMLHRPVTANPEGGAHIWTASSENLRDWGNHRILLPARQGSWWDANKIGTCTPPLKTKDGWLLLYHGVKGTVSGSIYRLGMVLLDLDYPEKVLGRCSQWVMAPQMEYEMYGDVNHVVFPCGWVARGDELLLYYGCADSCISLARASISELLAWLKTDNILGAF